MDVVGGLTGSMFPTGNRQDVIDGVAVSCVDVAMPMMIARAEAYGLTGHETAKELDQNRAFYDRMEPIRQKAGVLMGLGDVSQSVMPKVGFLAPARNGGTAATRYFMPWNCHPSLAVTGSQCMSAALLCPGTVGEGLVDPLPDSPAQMLLEHPMGMLEVLIDYRRDGDDFDLISAGLVRTARKLASGEAFIPASVWSREA
jgi:2-methylaconitate cis-trans-isomerase PrpF